MDVKHFSEWMLSTSLFLLDPSLVFVPSNHTRPLRPRTLCLRPLRMTVVVVDSHAATRRLIPSLFQEVPPFFLRALVS